jgi:hypothetical protein
MSLATCLVTSNTKLLNLTKVKDVNTRKTQLTPVKEDNHAFFALSSFIKKSQPT